MNLDKENKKSESMKEYELGLLRNYARKKMPDNLDVQTVDIKAIYDSSIPFSSNKRIIDDKIKIEKTDDLDRDEVESIKEKGEHLEQEQKELIEKKAEKEFEKSLKKIENDDTSKVIERYYEVPKNYIKMVAKGYSRGLILSGDFGMGKTYCAIRGVEEAGANMDLVKSHITPLELFVKLYENRNGGNLIIDDVEILGNEKNVNMIKAALDDNSRLVQWFSSTSKLDVPKQFIYNGTLIIIVNDMPRDNEDLKAMKSRVLNYNIDFDYKTKHKIIRSMARLDYEGIDKEERLKIARWLRKNSSKATKNLSLRLLFQLFEIYKYCRDEGKDWEKMGRDLIEDDEEIKYLIKCLDEERNVDEAQKRWSKIYGARATFYRRKRNNGL